jgi:hypothetical protein
MDISFLSKPAQRKITSALEKENLPLDEESIMKFIVNSRIGNFKTYNYSPHNDGWVAYDYAHPAVFFNSFTEAVIHLLQSGVTAGEL